MDKVHRHVCGHSNFNDVKLLLQRNMLWSQECSSYLSKVMEECKFCHLIDSPLGSRLVSLANMSRGFNEVVCVDHFFPENLDVFYVMDAKTRYSSGCIVSSTNMHEAVAAFDSHWVSTFWPPGSVQADQSFNSKEFKSYLNIFDIKLRPVPPYRHSNNVLESKHRILRDIYIRLRSESPSCDPRVLVSRMFRISNDLYGNDTASAHEMARCYTRPVSHHQPLMLPDDIRVAQENLLAKRKMNKILRSKSIQEIPVNIGDIIQIYTKLSHQKRGSWRVPKPVLPIDRGSRSVPVAGNNGRVKMAAIEDIRITTPGNELSALIQTSIDDMAVIIEEALDDLNIGAAGSADVDAADVSNASPMDMESVHNIPFPNAANDDYSRNVAEEDNSPDILREPVVPPGIEGVETGDGPLDDASSPDLEINLEDITYYPPGASISPTSQLPSVHPMTTRSDVHEAHEVELLPGTVLTSTASSVLQSYQERFGSKEFMIHQASGLPSFLTSNAYMAEQENFLKTCDEVHVNKVPANSNIISSHVLYKIKLRDDKSYMCKARIAPHGNKDRDKHLLKTDSSSCPPIGMRILLSLSIIFHSFLTKIDVKSAFLQTGRAERDIYVVPPKECAVQTFYWLLKTASYGLVNANAKWQLHSDTTFLDIGLSVLVQIPQLIYLRVDGVLVLVVAKIVDDILITGLPQYKEKFTKMISKVYELGTITHFPGSFPFFGLTITQNDDFQIELDAEDKLQNISESMVSRVRRKQAMDKLTSVELHRFNSVNGTVGFLGMTVSPLASFVASYLQQKRNCATVHHISEQNYLIRQLQRFGSTSQFHRPLSGTFELSVLVFSDAGRPSEYGQLGNVCCLFFGALQQNSIAHTLSWSSRLSKRPAELSGSAEVFAASCAIDDGKLLVEALNVLLQMHLSLRVVVDSKDLFESLTTCHVPTDKSIRYDVADIRYNFETKRISEMVWVPGASNLADVLTKKDSRVTDALQILLVDGKIPFHFPEAQSRASALFYR